MKSIYQFIAAMSFILALFQTQGQINLGTAENFILFTSVGAFDNVGPSVFTGDIGTHVGAITGFPPGIVNGSIEQANPTTLQAAADVETAYNNLTSIPCDSMLGTLLGSGQILTANNYCISAAATLTGDLILDGENNPNQLFVIKINGVLDVIGLSEIILINSALPNNVYWQINGALNIGADAIVKGTILANGALSFALGSLLIGHGLTRDGAINTTEMTAELSTESGMPIELIYFEGKVNETYNLLTWSTASEMNNDYFTIEKTSNGIDYTELTRINGAGSSSSQNSYNYADYNPDKTINYYRLSQTDYDGTFEIVGFLSLNNIPSQKQIIKIVNLLGQDIDEHETGIRLIYFSDGEILRYFGN
jgi:hypothetical protein